MKISLVGIGCGTAATLTEEGRQALCRADVIIGAARVLELLPEILPDIMPDVLPDFVPDILSDSELSGQSSSVRIIAETKPDRICDLLEVFRKKGLAAHAAIALSGDTGFYSGARRLREMILDRLKTEESGRPDKPDELSADPSDAFESDGNGRTGESGAEAETELEILPGISSVQFFAARLGLPWQDWNLVSAHGTGCDPVHEIMKGKATFFLTGGKYRANDICLELVKAGLGDLSVMVGENLSYGQERIFTGSALECSSMTFSDLSVILVNTNIIVNTKTFSAGENVRQESAGCGRIMAGPSGADGLIIPPRPVGIPDDEFCRGKVPMTKMEIRCIVLAKMGVGPDDVVWDIGAGTGSVSVELAMAARQVWALERGEEAIELIEKNRRKFGRWNLHAVRGNAPEDLNMLPAPDKVFIGGSGGCIGDIMRAVWARNREAHICISAILLETLQESMEVFSERGIEPEIVQIAVSRAEPVGGRHMMRAGNPVYVISQ